MCNDNSRFIIDAAERRRVDVLAVARVKLAQALTAGEPTSIRQLAASANVSPSWLYAGSSLQR